MRQYGLHFAGGAFAPTHLLRRHSRRWFCIGGVACLGSLVLAATRYPKLHASSGGPYKLDPFAAEVEHRAWLIGENSFWLAERDDNLLQIARRTGLGYTELIAANPNIDPWLPKPGTRIVLPTSHLMPAPSAPGILINLAQQRLFVVQGADAQVSSFPIGIGQEGWETPVGRTQVVRLREDPVWRVPPSIRAEVPSLPETVPPGPDNPLGTHAIDLGWQGFVIHGTNQPNGVGRRVSHGCIRLYPEDIEQLFEMVHVGMPVTVVDTPIISGWVGTTLYVEAHPTQRQSDQIEVFGKVVENDDKGGLDDIVCAAGRHADNINWQRVAHIVQSRRGIPRPVLYS